MTPESTYSPLSATESAGNGSEVSRWYPWPDAVSWGRGMNGYLEERRQSALAELAAIHAERVEVVKAMKTEMGPVRIAEVLGVSRQMVQRLLRGD